MAGQLGNLLYQMQQDGANTDVTFVVEASDVLCHKLVIMANGGSLAELVGMAGNVITVQDISLRAFKSIIQYTYTGECPVSPANAFEILHAAKKFGIKELEDQCVTIGATKLTEDNILAYTQEAIDFDSKEFLSSCRQYAKQNTKAIVKQPAFEDVSVEVLEMIYSLDGTNCSVLELFAACMGWAEEECRRQKLEKSSESIQAVLRKVVDKIKFGDMAMDDFLEFVVPEGILTDEKVGQLINGWQKDKKNDWKEIVEVKIFDPSSNSHTIADLPLHTRIRDIKKMKIFNYGELQGPCDKFTLGYWKANTSYEKVSDSTALASIKEEGEYCIVLCVKEMTCIVKDSKDQWEIPVTFTYSNLWDDRTDEVIREHMTGHYETRGYDIGCAKIEEPDPFIPGSTFIVTAQPK